MAGKQIPFPFVTGLPLVAQKELERDFLAVQQQLGGSKEAALFVAASSCSAAEKAGADLICTGTGDATAINVLLAANPGRLVVFSGGIFDHDVTIVVPAGTTLMGAGRIAPAGGFG